jgi:sugar fermentation stimulation protein A
MRFPDPLIRGHLRQRYKRFLSDVELDDGSVVTAHCANPGSMLGLKEPGSEVWLSPARNPKRKLRYSWELVAVGNSLVGINTALPNGIAEDAIREGAIEELQGYQMLRREVKYGENSRIDILLQDDDKADCYVEIKSVTLMRQSGLAEFPDSVTARGAKHLVELGNMVADGHRAVMLYLIQRGDCDHFDIARDIDPKYDAAINLAQAAGVEAICYDCRISPEEIVVNQSIPLDFLT